MFAIVLSLGAALAWGSSDFLGGLKSRTLPLLTVLLISQATALILLVISLLVRAEGPPDAAALGQAAAAGLGEMVGIIALYRGLSVGTMSIVAPVASAAPAVPLLAGLVTGSLPGTVQFIGLGLALIGLVITSYRPGGGGNAESRDDGSVTCRGGVSTHVAGGAETRQDGRAGARQNGGAEARVAPSIMYGLLAALGFGSFFVLMGGAGEHDVGWALLMARLTSVTVIASIALIARHRVSAPKDALPALVAVGVLMVAADAQYTLATTLGLVSIAAVLGSLHTVVTMALARIVLKERLERPQKVGVTTALVGVLTLSAA
jgi:drug/metabolite transporter (DMT)-like permease